MKTVKDTEICLRPSADKLDLFRNSTFHRQLVPASFFEPPLDTNISVSPAQYTGLWIILPAVTRQTERPSHWITAVNEVKDKTRQDKFFISEGSE